MKNKTHKTTSLDFPRIRRSAVMECVRGAGPVTIADLARATRLRTTTVNKVIAELIGLGLVKSSDESRQSVEFAARANLVIGIDLGGTKCYGAVTNLAGEIVQEKTITRHQTQGEGSYQMVVEFLDDLLTDASRLEGRVRGVGVGVPGVMEAASGLVKVCPSLDWEDFPLQERLTSRFDIPVVVENDVNLAALGELWFGVERGIDDLVLVAIGTGIGSGIVLGGRVHAGAHSLAGEIGYLLPDAASLRQEYPGYGALEQRISGTGIAERARARLSGSRSMQELESLTAEDVFAAVRKEESWAREILDETLDWLAQAVAALQLIINPQVILLSGGVTREADLLLTPVLQRLEGRIPVLPDLRVSRLGYRAGVLGAAVKVYRSLLGHVQVTPSD